MPPESKNTDVRVVVSVVLTVVLVALFTIGIVYGVIYLERIGSTQKVKNSISAQKFPVINELEDVSAEAVNVEEGPEQTVVDATTIHNILYYSDNNRSEETHYWTDGSFVYFIYGFSTTTVLDAIPGTFKVIINDPWIVHDLATDGRNLYLRDGKIAGTYDVATFGTAWFTKHGAVFKDKDRLYWLDGWMDGQFNGGGTLLPILNSDSATLRIHKVIHNFDGGLIYASDKNQFYCGTIIAYGISPQAEVRSLLGTYSNGIPVWPSDTAEQLIRGGYYLVDGQKYFTGECRPVVPSSFESGKDYQEYVEQLRSVGEKI